MATDNPMPYPPVQTEIDMVLLGELAGPQVSAQTQRLIASARALLAALDKMMGLYERTGDHVRHLLAEKDCVACEARELIRQATGETQ